MAFNISSCWKHLLSVFCCNIVSGEVCQFFPVVVCVWVVRGFSTQTYQIADLQNYFWMWCFLTIVIGFLPVATKLLLHKQFQGSCVVMQGKYQIDPLNCNCNPTLILSLTYSQGKDDLSHAFLMSHFIVSSLPPFENCQGSVEDDISQRG